MKRLTGLIAIAAVLAIGLAASGGTLEARILEPSVTIQAGHATGSGVVFTREGVNYVVTAAHVVASQRSITSRLVDGIDHKKETFADVQVIKVLYANERKVGKIEMDAEVLAYSDADDGHDLALLRIRKHGFIATTAVFHLGTEQLPIGTRLFHCGSLQGEMGSSSLTNGIISRVGRVYRGKAFNQSNATAFPGSSGGGVFTEDGHYIGAITRGAGETFNLYIPSRRVIEWLDEAGYRWVVDPKAPKPDPKAAAK